MTCDIVDVDFRYVAAVGGAVVGCGGPNLPPFTACKLQWRKKIKIPYPDGAAKLEWTEWEDVRTETEG